jgi:hypothetical protein
MKQWSINEVIEQGIVSALRWLHVALPGRVKAYDKARGTADVEICVKLPTRTLQDLIYYFPLPTIPDVPVAWPSGGGYFVAMPLAVNDPVLLVFADIAMGEYLENADISDPVDTRRHSLGYPIAIPGGARPNPKALSDLPDDGVIVGKDGSDQQIKIDNSFISLGKGATDFAALASLVKSELQAIKTIFDAHTHPVPAGPGTSSPSATPLNPIGEVKATLVKAK